MALRSERSSAFDVGSPPRGKRGKRETYKLNVTLDKALKAPLKRAAIERDMPLQALAEELFVGYLLDKGLIDERTAGQVSRG